MYKGERIYCPNSVRLVFLKLRTKGEGGGEEEGEGKSQSLGFHQKANHFSPCEK